MNLKFKKWDGQSDIGKTVLVKTDQGNYIVAHQAISLPKMWTIYIPGISLLFQPALDEKVIEYAELPLNTRK